MRKQPIQDQILKALGAKKMAKMPELRKFAKKHNLKMLSIGDLLEYMKF